MKFGDFEFRGETFRHRILPKLGKARFAWKTGSRLSFLLGGQVIAAWPSKDRDNMFLALVQTKMLLGETTELSQDQGKIRRLAFRLRKALIEAETGKRQRTVYRQRRRLERLFLQRKSRRTALDAAYELRKWSEEYRESKRRQRLDRARENNGIQEKN
jgi:hypothetical protein